jgi:GNAT superfamily N-acetyltransferase
MTTRSELLEAYDAGLRIGAPRRLPAGASCERDGPLHRFLGFDGGGFVVYRELGDLEGDALDALIARQVETFAARGEPFEWKLHGHDLPADLADRLRRAGLEPDETETVMIAAAAAIVREPRPPAGLTLRAVRARHDLDRIAALEHEIWGDDRNWVAASLAAELAADETALDIIVAEAGTTLVGAGWMRFAPELGFATLWGGGTLPGWRGRGSYRALVAERAARALARNIHYLQVDASPASRPILERLGFLAVTTTTPFRWRPSPR